MKELEFSRDYQFKWGLGDPNSETEEILREAIASGRNFTTPWMEASKTLTGMTSSRTQSSKDMGGNRDDAALLPLSAERGQYPESYRRMGGRRMKLHYYPWEKPAPDNKRQIEEEPDVIQTYQGFSPNYDKFEALGMTTEEALVWCNMD